MLRVQRREDATVITGEDISSVATFMVGGESPNDVLQIGDRFPQVRLQLRGCQRCGGDVTTERDWDGDYIRCLQCGWYKDAPGDAVTELVDTAMARLLEEMEQPRAS